MEVGSVEGPAGRWLRRHASEVPIALRGDDVQGFDTHETKFSYSGENAKHVPTIFRTSKNTFALHNQDTVQKNEPVITQPRVLVGALGNG